MADVFLMALVASLDAGLLAAAVVLLGRPRPAHKLLAYLVGAMGFSIGFGLSERAVGKDSLWIAWAAGALYSVPGAYYLGGMALLAKQDTSVVTDVVVVVAFNVIMFALIELPLLGFRVAPERTRARTGR